MKKIFFTVLALFFVSTANAQTNIKVMQNTGKQTVPTWESVLKYEEQSLPKSALDAVNAIYSNALAEADSPSLIKAIIYKLKYQTAIDIDEFPALIAEIEAFAETDANVCEQSILYSLIATLYYQYYITTASTNQLIARITDLAMLSVAQETELQKTDVLKYQDILITGESSRTQRPTLYDFLIFRAIELIELLSNNSATQNYFLQTKPIPSENFAPAEEWITHNIKADDYDLPLQILKLYQKLLTFRISQNNELALLMADLERLDFVNDNSSDSGASYLNALDHLEKKYENQDFCAEILIKKAEFYQMSHVYDVVEDSDESQNYKKEEKIFEICNYGLAKYPNYSRIGRLANILSDITQSQLTASSPITIYPEKDLEIKLNYQNISEIIVDIYSIDAPVTLYAYQRNRNGLYEDYGKLIETKHFSLINDKPYVFSDTTLTIPIKNLGVYEYVINTPNSSNQPANGQFSVSRLATISRTVDGKREFLVVDRISGKPAVGATINLYKRTNDDFVKINSLKTDENGLATGGNSKDEQYYNAEIGQDKGLIASPTPWISTYRNPESDTEIKLDILTDRSIYRPGQIVYFKGITYDRKKQTVVPNRDYNLTVRDNNGKEISALYVHTSEYGSFTGAFTIPEGLLNGVFSINAGKDNGYASFRVEEYKRPTFEVKFNENDIVCRLNEKAVVGGTAKTYSGVPLQNATVKYRITRSYHWFYRIYRLPVQVAEGEVKTSDSGDFEIAFTPERAFEDRQRKSISYTFTVEASITDSKGETQLANFSLNIGDKSAILGISGLIDATNKDSLKTVKITAVNMSGKTIAVGGKYKIFSLRPKQADKLNNSADDWAENKQLFENAFESGKDINLVQINSLTSGRYRIVATAADAEDFTFDFTLFSTKDKHPPVPLYKWCLPIKTTCKVGEKAEIIFGSSAKSAYVLYEIFHKEKKLAVSRLVLNNENRRIEIPFLEQYGDGISVKFTLIKDAQVFSEDIRILRELPDKELTLKMDVFRDRLLPGQKEEWKISVADVSGKGAVSELLASMYDASLDAILMHQWSFYPAPTLSVGIISQILGGEFRTTNVGLWIPYNRRNVSMFDYDELNLFNFIYDYRVKNDKMNGVLRSSQAFAQDEGVVIAELREQAVNMQDEVTVAALKSSAAEEPVQIRENFAETAFYYPQLKTDSTGRTIISFTVPESNTTWKFMALAHTKDLKFGQLIEKAISQKQLMVAPNVPRFLRQGDKASISATVSNLSESAQSGKASLLFFDPETERLTIAVANSEQSFVAEAGKTVSLTWTFDVPQGIDLTAMKIVARTADFSDGEQHLVPVLPNRMLITESIALNVTGAQTKTFTMPETPSASREDYRMTLEFTGNPLWYAIQALPTITSPQSDNVFDWFAAFYSNNIAVRIAKSNPKIRQVIAAWKADSAKETLLSNLEKNSELKATLLEETPWVMEAKSESEQKQRLMLLFDDNHSANLRSQALDKIKALQGSDGGWGWFKGMNSSISITRWMLYGFAQSVGQSNDFQSFKDNFMKNAIAFVDKTFKKHFEDLKKYNKDWQKTTSISVYELEYLFVRSMYSDIPLGETKEAFDFYLNLADKYWTKSSSLYERAIAAITLNDNGKQKTATAIIKSLREHSSHKADYGMFWANNRAQTFAFQSATCVHTFIMQAFNEVGTTSSSEMEEMQLWLLRQKQTQQWESVPATVGAIEMLLKTSSDQLADKGKVSLKWGDKTISTEQGETGAGYVKQSVVGKEITPDLRKITVSKADAGAAWGALYIQYFEDLDKIKASNTGLNIEKTLFVEKTGLAGKVLQPITEKEPIKTGDKVTVRLTVRADRDYEFVMLKDLRASCFEPVEQLSGIQWKQGTIYYQSPKDASMNFYFDNLAKGVYVFEYGLYATSEGEYSNGTATVQCLYAPEFTAHTSGGKVRVEPKE
ncbi:MAG: hypothetical protein LBR13_02550 [Dysgonamonadaceae bacterium]|jgi:uncharacterized protein YfaS (alpha-2-macroglobulin family)|nr:hypothetical protein [Dysgonamonadaceae bacterium]